MPFVLSTKKINAVVVIPQLQTLLTTLIGKFFWPAFTLNEKGIFIGVSQMAGFLDGRAERRAA
jgi:hypothetical protein